MPIELLKIDSLLPAFGLVLARVAGLVMATPMLSSRQIPTTIKVWFVATLSLMAFPAVHAHLPQSLSLGHAATGMLGEFVIGEVLGFSAALTFFAAQVAGKLVSHQSGMALGTVFNPIFDSESTVLDQVWFFTVLMVFVMFRGHLAVVRVLLTSFRDVPPMMASFDGTLADYIVSLLRTMFELAMRLAGPAVLALLLTSLIMGFLTKTMPQLNVLSVGFAFKIVTALFIMAVTVSYSEEVLADALFDGLDRVGRLFESMSTAVMRAG